MLTKLYRTYVKSLQELLKFIRRPFALSAVLSAAIRAGNVLLSLLLAIILARSLGPEGYGIYAFALALISVLSIPASFGMPKLVLRETSSGEARQQWGRVLGVWRWTSSLATVSSIIVIVVLTCALLLWPQLIPGSYFYTIAAALLAIPFVALGDLCGAALTGLRHVLLGQLPASIFRPSLLVLLLLGMIASTREVQLTPVLAMVGHSLAAMLSFAMAAHLLRRLMPKPLLSRPKLEFDSSAWLWAILPLSLTSGMLLINSYTDILVLGAFYPAQDVGVYRVAVQGAGLVTFAPIAVAGVIAPYFARNYALGDTSRLERLVKLSSRGAFIVACCVTFVLLIWGQKLLKLFFGAEFIVAYIPLVILALGQLANACFGPVGWLLNMTGFERDTATGVAIAAGANVLLNLALIPPFGMNGAATATAISIVFWNFLLWRKVRQRLSIDSMAIGLGKVVRVTV